MRRGLLELACWRDVENSGWLLPITDLNMRGGMPGCSASDSFDAAAGFEYFPESSPWPSFTLHHTHKASAFCVKASGAGVAS